MNDEIEDRDDQIEYLTSDVTTLKNECRNLKSMLVDHNHMKEFAMKLEKDLTEARLDKKNAETLQQNVNFEKRQLISKLTFC